MRFRNRSACLAFTALVFAVLPGLAAAQESPWEKENADWREAHKADLLKPDGWLSLAGLEWLQPGDNSVGSAPDSKIHLASGPARDRKSTRLNSSHQIISYAVFCLKKKKI